MAVPVNLGRSVISGRYISTAGALRNPVTGRFIPNPVGIAALMATPEMVAAMFYRAKNAANETKRYWVFAGPHPYETGEYEDNIEATAGIIDARAVGRVNAFSEHSGYIEFGTEDTPTFAPLNHGLEAIGLKGEASKGGGLL